MSRRRGETGQLAGREEGRGQRETKDEVLRFIFKIIRSLQNLV